MKYKIIVLRIGHDKNYAVNIGTFSYKSIPDVFQRLNNIYGDTVDILLTEVNSDD